MDTGHWTGVRLEGCAHLSDTGQGLERRAHFVDTWQGLDGRAQHVGTGNWAGVRTLEGCVYFVDTW